MSDDLLRRWRDGELGPGDDAAFAAWLAADPRHVARAHALARFEVALGAAARARAASERDAAHEPVDERSSPPRDAVRGEHASDEHRAPATAAPRSGRVRRTPRPPQRRRWLVPAGAAVGVALAAIVVAHGTARPPSKPDRVDVVAAEDDLPTVADEAAAPRPAHAGDRVVAQRGGTALTWPDGSRVTLAVGADAVIVGGKRLRLDRGALTAEIAPQQADRPCAIATPLAVAEVVGTAFSLTAEDDGARLAVAHGRVRLRRVADDHAVLVDAGSCAVVADGIAFAARVDAAARRIDATPETWRARFATLRPGDTAVLAAGDYDGLAVSGLAGEPGAWITIRGPEVGVARIRPRPGANTVEIADSAYVRISGLDIDGTGTTEAFGVSAKGDGGVVHHIAIEGCRIHGFDADQQLGGISTKLETWGWRIVGNRIDGCGTGMSLGDSDGASPFVGGLVAGNVVTRSLGYCLQIMPGAPPRRAPSAARRPTIIADNVFLKDDRPSPLADRPNVLVDGGGDADAGFDIARNVFWHNPRQVLLQGSGRLAIHDNVFADAPLGAILLADHGGPVRSARIVENTVLAASPAVRVDAAGADVAVRGNALFVATAVVGAAQVDANLVATVDQARSELIAPSLTLGEADLHPRPGRCLGPPLPDATGAAATDFDGRPRGAHDRRGAYAGDGGGAWRLAAEPKPSPRDRP